VGLLSHIPLKAHAQSEIDLDRLSLLIDPTTTTRLYSSRKWIGPTLTWMRRSLVRILYFLFRLDFSRLIELHQNVWIMAYQIQEMQARLNALEIEQREWARAHDTKKDT
jgi:hypothetical protein